MAELTYRSIELRTVSVPLRRPVVSKVGRFDEWPLILIDVQTAEGVVGRSYLDNTDYEAMAETVENAMVRVPALEKARIARGWAGLYEISPEHHAIMGKVPEVAGFVLANGFSGHGFQHSPAVGKVIAELIVDG